MKRTIKPVCVFFLWIFLCSCVRTPTVLIGDHRFFVETARTEAERGKGLMFRKKLPRDGGMLFIFEAEQPLSFWMRNTSLPLSIAYISEDGFIIDIFDLKPYDEQPVRSTRPAKYALEVNRGAFRKKGIRPGDKVQILGIKP